MRWKGGRRSSNVEDRRGESPGYSAAGAAPLVLRFLPASSRGILQLVIRFQAKTLDGASVTGAIRYAYKSITAMLLQRARLKSDQQLVEWPVQ
jgi:predicted metalloprotease